MAPHTSHSNVMETNSPQQRCREEQKTRATVAGSTSIYISLARRKTPLHIFHFSKAGKARQDWSSLLLRSRTFWFSRLTISGLSLALILIGFLALLPEHTHYPNGTDRQGSAAQSSPDLVWQTSSGTDINISPQQAGLKGNRLGAGIPGKLQQFHTMPLSPGRAGIIVSNCDTSKALNDANQTIPCDWDAQEYTADARQWTTYVTCISDPNNTWKKNTDGSVTADNPLIFDCTHYYGGTTYYCEFDPTVILKEERDIRCSTSETTTNGKPTPGALQSCSYTWGDMDFLGSCQDDPCASYNPTTDPITGIPQPANQNDSQASTCPLAKVPTACSNAYDANNDWLFGSNNGLLYASTATQTADKTVGITLVNTLWKALAGLALAMLAIPFALAGYQIMRGMGSENHSKSLELLSKVILVGIAVGMSWTIVSWLIQFEDGLAHYASTTFVQTTPISMPSSNWQCYTHQFFGTLYNMNIDATNNAAKGSGGTSAFVTNMSTATLTLIENLPEYILTLLSILLALQLVVRLVLINLYIVISPLAIFCTAMPGKIGANATSAWVKGLASLLAVQIVQMLILLVIGHTFATTLSTTTWSGVLFTRLLPITMMMMALNVPRLFNSSTTSLLSTVSSSIGGAMSGISMIIRGL